MVQSDWRVGTATELITLRVNGESHSLTLDPRPTLFDSLRETLRLTGTKIGASVRNADLARNTPIVAPYPVLSQALLSGVSSRSCPTWLNPSLPT